MTPKNERLLRALRCEPVDRTPVWFMRQAGRYLPEYRKVRGDRDILASLRDPDEVVELTLQPLRRMPLDAAIVFGDIMAPLAATGLPIRIEAGRGPVLDEPFRTAADLRRLRPLEPEEDEPALSAAIRTLVAELDVPLIGFAGAPFTLASYLIEGGPSRDFARTKALMLGDPATWDGLMDALLAVIEPHVRAQVTAGAAAVQIFDSWAGALSPAHYETSAAPYVRRLFAAIAGEGVPSISFGVGTSELLEVMRDAGGDAIGIDARTPLDRAWARLPGSAVQGNLDPAALLAPADVIERETLDVLARAGGRPGHVFNLGHGVLPATPVEALQRVVDVVHARTQRDG